MRKAVTAAALVLSAAATLTACGSSGGSGATSEADKTKAYCKQLAADKKYFAALGSSDGSNIEDVFNRFHELAAKSPKAVAPEWKVVDGAFSTIESDLKTAGITFTQLQQAQSTGKLPSGVDASQLQKVVSDFQSLGTKVTKAGDGIEKHAKSECKIDLGSS